MEIDSIDERRTFCAGNFELFINLVENLNESSGSINIQAISLPISPFMGLNSFSLKLVFKALRFAYRHRLEKGRVMVGVHLLSVSFAAIKCKEAREGH